MLDARDPSRQPRPRGAREEQRLRPADRRVAVAHDPLRGHRREEADRDRVRDVERRGEAAGEIEPREVGRLEPERPQQDLHADRVGGLRLGEVARVGAGERDPAIRHDRHLGAAVGEDAAAGVMAPVRRSSARRSTSPEPQIPSGSTSPMVRTTNAPSTLRTDSIAPSEPGIP